MHIYFIDRSRVCLLYTFLYYRATLYVSHDFTSVDDVDDNHNIFLDGTHVTPSL
jgi:hypothetical protein